MLTFNRNKLVSIHRKEDHTLTARGILEDDIYGMELELDIDPNKMTIVSIEGKWIRMENAECPRALPFLQEAVGYCLNEPDFTQKVQKTVGRKSCRHFANILLECCEAVREAAVLLELEPAIKRAGSSPAENASHEKNDKDKASSTISPGVTVHHGRESQDQKSAKNGSGKGLVIDLHVHSSEASPCSSAPLKALVEEAKRIGLDGICLTDHNHVWDPETVADLKKAYDFFILRGNEISTDQGDMLVFGFDEDVQGIIQLADLKPEVVKSGGFIIAAHPFRGFLTFGIGQLGLTAEKAMERPLFQHVDAVEVLNSKVSEKENRFSSKVAEGLHLPQTGGSDAHEVEEVGIYATRFFDAVTDEKTFVKALREGNYQPVAFRKSLA